MKKLITLTAALAITGTALFAQKTSFGIIGGVQSNSVQLRADEDIAIDAPGTGFIIGGVVDLKLSNNFSIRPNLLLSYKSGKMYGFAQGKYNAMSIDVPINAVYHYNGFFIGAGPNISYGLSNKIKPFDDDDEDMDLYEEADGEDAVLKRFEIGVNAVMGYQFPNGFGIQTNFTRGLNNLINLEDNEGDVKWNYRQFGLSFTYLFGKKK